MPVSSLQIEQIDQRTPQLTSHVTRPHRIAVLLLFALAGWNHFVFAGFGLPDQNSPLAIIQAYADSNINPTPALADYTTLGIDCVIEDNLAVVNTAIEKLARAEITSTQDVQTLVDSVLETTVDSVIAQLALIAYAEDSTNPPPTEEDYKALGINGVTAENIGIINQALGQLTGDAVDTPSKVQTLIDHLLTPTTTLRVRGLLQGAYQADSGWMDDTLRILHLIPASQPYQMAPFGYHGAENLDDTLLTITGSDAIVDWVLIELRDQHTPATLIHTQAALLQRDGDVIDPITATTTLRFPHLPAGNYFVTLRHRNHLPVMTQTPIPLSENTTLVDFTLATTPLYGTLPTLRNGNLMLLWAGDVNADNSIVANGPLNDAGVMLTRILMSSTNTGFNTNYQHSGYEPTDLNMDGLTRFIGPSNDTNLLVGNTLLYPSNTSYSANYIIRGNLP